MPGPFSAALRSAAGTTFRQLVYFAKGAELGSLTNAAAVLNLTQPALGVQVRKLEEYLDVPLIERHSRGIRLTEAGQTLYKHALRLIEGLEAAKADVRQFGKDAVGTIRIGVTPSMGRVVVPRLLQECADLYPTLKLQLTQGFSEYLETAVRENQLDFAVTNTAIETELLESLPFYIETFLLVCDPRLLPETPEVMTLEALSRLPLALDGRSHLLRRKLDDALAEQELTFQDVLEISAIHLRRELVLQGRRAAVATRALFQDELTSGRLIALPIDMDGLRMELNLSTRRVEKMSPAEAAIRQLLISIVDDVIARGDVDWSMPGR